MTIPLLGLNRRKLLGGAAGIAGAALVTVPAGAVEPAALPVDPDAYPFSLTPGTWTDLRDAARPVVLSAVLPASPAKVFRTLADPEPWPRWLSMVQAVRYRSDAREVGCERDVTVGTGDVIREHFIAWEPGARLTFYVSSSTSSLPSLFMEDYLLLPVDGGGGATHTRLRWTVQMALHAPASLLTPMAKAYFRSQASIGLQRLALLLAPGP